MKYELTQTILKEEDKQETITLTLNTDNGGSFEIYAYNVEMCFEDFLIFANAVQELREKFAKLQGNG